MQRELTRTFKLWRKELENAESALADTSDISILQQRRNALEAGMSSLTIAHDNLVNLLSTAEIDELTKRHDAWYMEHREYLRRLTVKANETNTVPLSQAVARAHTPPASLLWRKGLKC